MRQHKFMTTVAVFVAAACPAAAETVTCPALLAQVNQAVAKKSLQDLKRLEALVSTDLDCFDQKATVRAKRAQLEVDLTADPAGPFATDTEREAALVDAADRSDLWIADERLGDLLAKDRRWRDAAARYDAAVTKAARFATLSDEEKRRLLNEAGAAKMLASNDAEGTRHVELAMSSRSAGDGKIGGIYSPSLRGARPVAVPVPIQFETGLARLTATGKRAADELIQALKEQGVTGLTLVGHTDPRGSDGYNMQLSAQRLASVKQYLTAMDAGLQLSLVPKGKSEPFDVDVLPYHPTQEETWALDRRVEWLR